MYFLFGELPELPKNKDKDNTVSRDNDDPKSRTQPLLQGTKTHFFGHAPEVYPDGIRTQQHNTNPIAMIPTIVQGTETTFCGNVVTGRRVNVSSISLSAHNSNTVPGAHDKDKDKTDPGAMDHIDLEE